MSGFLGQMASQARLLLHCSLLTEAVLLCRAFSLWLPGSFLLLRVFGGFATSLAFLHSPSVVCVCSVRQWSLLINFSVVVGKVESQPLRLRPRHPPVVGKGQLPRSIVNPALQRKRWRDKLYSYVVVSTCSKCMLAGAHLFPENKLCHIAVMRDLINESRIIITE